MALNLIQIIRLNIQDTVAGLYILSDAEIEYFLQKNENNINRTSLDCARVVLLNLSMRGDHTTDILSIKGSKAAESYRLALQMFLRDPNMNPVLTNCQGYAGGISISDMQSNVDNTDNNYARTPEDIPVNPVIYPQQYSAGYSSDYFRI